MHTLRLLIRLLIALLLAALAVPKAQTLALGAGVIVPPGFRVDLYAGGLTSPTAMSFGPDKRLYVSQADGHILAIGNHRIVRVASGFATPLGLTWYGRRLFVSSTGTVSTLTPSRGFSRFARRDIITGLPTGRHQNDGLVFHGGWIYLGVGSTCDACRERNPRSATIMRFRPDGTRGQIYAHGLRNPYGLAIQPGTGRLYATDNGRDDHDDQVPDELNRIVPGGRYAFPSCWGNGGGTGCRGTIAPVALFEPHSSADGLCFYSGRTFPARYRGDAFVAEWGATVGAAATGHRVKDVHFSSNRVTTSDFATGLQHPLAVVNARDGSLLIADYGTGIIWHVHAAR
ncbi:MAG: PQQ-dependent sugar dehydrogenase [Chloroflexota bacterium]